MVEAVWMLEALVLLVMVVAEEVWSSVCAFVRARARACV